MDIPTETFNITGTTTAEDYSDFIKRLRDRFRDETRDNPYGRPLLIAQETVPTQFVDLVLNAGERTAVRLRIRRDSLYIIAYRDETLHGPWFEFMNNGSVTLIPAAEGQREFLPFDSVYSTLENSDRSDRRENIALGGAQLTAAVYELLKEGGKKARALLVIVQMISESMRLTELNTALIQNWEQGFKPETPIIELENCWGPLSEEVLHRWQHPNQTYHGPNGLNHITSLHAAYSALGMILRPKGFTMYSEVAAESDATTYRTLIADGRVLVEFFRVRVMNIDNETTGNLYGDIRVMDGLMSYPMYHRDEEPYQVLPNLSFTLTSKTIDKVISSDDPIASGELVWNPYDHTNIYNKVLTKLIDGKFGSIALEYAVMSNAAEALLEIVLINGDGEDPADVYGQIWAKNSVFDKPFYLWNYESTDSIPVGKNLRIPIGRTALALPLDATLTIGAKLSDWDAAKDDEIANGEVEFKPKLRQSETQSIRGTHGEIEVRVSWY